MEHVIELLNLITEDVDRFVSSDVVMGEPIRMGDITLVTLSKISVGLGAGGGEGEGHHSDGSGKHKCHPMGKGSGVGTGGGARIQPVGVVVFSKQGVEVKLVKASRGPLQKLFDKLPEMAEWFKKNQKENG